MKKLLTILFGILLIGAGCQKVEPQSISQPEPQLGTRVLTERQGGTGSSTPYQLLYGNAGTIESVGIGSNLTLTDNILSASGGAAFAWTPDTNYSVNVNSTSTPLWLQNGLMVSTTAYLAFVSSTSGDFDEYLFARNFGITGTGGAGYMDFLAQSSNPSAPSAGTARFHAATTQGFTRFEQDNEASTNIVIGRDSVVIAKNTSGVDISKGQVVYVTGSTGNVPNIAKAQANSITTLPALFMAVDDITNNNFGQVMRGGIISNFDTSAFSSGAQVWVSTSTAGGLTAIRPSGGTDYIQRVGTILVSGVGNGSIDVQIAPALLNMETGTNQTTWSGKNIQPLSNNLYNAGTFGNAWKNIAASSTAYLDFVSSTALEVGGTLISNDGTKTTILPLTGDYLRIGDAGTTNHALSNNDDLLVSMDLEVDGTTYLDGLSVFGANSRVATNIGLYFGAGTSATSFAIFGASTQTNDETPMFALPNDTRTLLILEQGDTAFDFAHPNQNSPTLFIHSANQSKTEWIGLTHNSVDGELSVGQGYLVVSSTALVIPTSTNPIIGRAGAMAVNTTAASSSIRFHDNTAERALYDTTEKTIIIASSTLTAYAGATVSSTIEFGFASVHGETWEQIHCITDAGTAEIEFGDGTNWMDYQKVSSTKTSDTSLSNNTFTMGEERFMRIGQTSGFNTLACTAVIRIDAD